MHYTQPYGFVCQRQKSLGYEREARVIKYKFLQKEVPCMEITSSYQVEILSNADMKSTVQIYRRALAFVIDVCNKEF